MKTYLIRVLGDGSGALAGTARVFDIRDLWLTMDEFGNPHEFEYLRVGGTCIFCNAGYGWHVNESVQQSIPLTAEDREYFGEDDEDDVAVGSWETIVGLCGGQKKFDKMYHKIYRLPETSKGGEA